MPHLLVDISAHGYGHVAQTAPLLNELKLRLPELRITVRSAAPLALLQQRIQGDFQHYSVAFDFGMHMASAVDVQVAESDAAYRRFHAEWPRKVAREAQIMRDLRPDLLLANVPYLSLAAAHQAGVRSVGMCCLNWADIYRHYCVQDADSRAIHAQMLDAYNSAECFLKVQPSMPMPDFARGRSVGPIVQQGSSQRSRLAAQGALRMEEKWVLVAMGGMEFRLPMERWPQLSGVHWLVPQAWGITRHDVTAFETLGVPFSDVLASCDATLTKPGYGTFAEAACAGVPVLYVTRRNWPEEPYLVQWLGQNGVCLEVQREALQTGDLAGLLQALWAQPQPARPHASGAGDAAQYLLDNYF